MDGISAQVFRCFSLCSALILLFICSSQVLSKSFPEKFIEEQITKAKVGVEVDLQVLNEGDLLKVEYVDRPIYIYKRTPQDLYLLDKGIQPQLFNSDINLIQTVRNSYVSSSDQVWTQLLLQEPLNFTFSNLRSKSREYLVIAGWGPSSGCVLYPKLDKSNSKDVVRFTDECNKTQFDASGRILDKSTTNQSINAELAANIFVPPHRFIDDNRVLIEPFDSEMLSKEPFVKERYKGVFTLNEQLHVAARYNDLNKIKEIFSENPQLSLADEDTRIIDAAIIGSSYEIIELLISYGAQPTTYSAKGAKFLKREHVVTLIEQQR